MSIFDFEPWTGKFESEIHGLLGKIYIRLNKDKQATYKTKLCIEYTTDLVFDKLIHGTVQIQPGEMMVIINDQETIFEIKNRTNNFIQGTWYSTNPIDEGNFELVLFRNSNR